MSGLQHRNGNAPVPKSVLKKTLAPNPPPPPGRALSREEKNRELALHHANLIQQRKDVELSILESIETLMDFPSPATTDPAHPAPVDAKEVAELMQPFQPSDFDSLVEERNIDGKCGYVLCPRPHRVEKTQAKYRILNGGGRGASGFRIVEKADLEKWCSDPCGRDALYMRVQLSELPAWERNGHLIPAIEIYGQRAMASRSTDVDSLTQNLDQLALERGDKNAGAYRSSSLAVRLKENNARPGFRAQPPSGGHHAAIDGYVPSDKSKQKAPMQRRYPRDKDLDDMMDTI